MPENQANALTLLDRPVITSDILENAPGFAICVERVAAPMLAPVGTEDETWSDETGSWTTWVTWITWVTWVTWSASS